MIKKILVYCFIFLFSITLYCFVLGGVKGNIRSQSIKGILDQAEKPLELSPERGRFILTMSLADDHSFALSHELAEAASPDVGYYSGRYYVFFAPGISILALPFYLLGKTYGLSQVFSFISIAFFASLTLVFLYKIMREILRLPFWASIIGILIYGFGSTSLSYATTMYQHHVTVFFMMTAFYSAWRATRSKNWSWFFTTYVWAVYGLSIFLDYPNVLLLAPVIAYSFFTSFDLKQTAKKIIVHFKTAFIATSIIFFLLVGLHAYYNQVNFGSWHRLSGSLVSIDTVKKSQKLGAKKSKETIAQVANKKSDVVNFFSEFSFPKGFSILTFSRDRGLFLYAPIFVLGILGILLAIKELTKEQALLLGLLGVNFFLYSSWGDPWGGWAYGPRYLIPSMAILSMFVATFLSSVRHKFIASILAFFLFAYSSFIAFLGALTTKQVPPKVEADYLHMHYNFLLNWQYFIEGKTGSFVYNTYLSHTLSLIQYFAILYGFTLLVAALMLFVVPFFEKHEH